MSQATELLKKVSLQDQVLAKLAENPEWREELLADPRAAVTELLGVTLPESVNFTVHTNSITNINLVIPPTQSELDELDLETLDLVGGGFVLEVILQLIAAGMVAGLGAVTVGAGIAAGVAIGTSENS